MLCKVLKELFQSSGHFSTIKKTIFENLTKHRKLLFPFWVLRKKCPYSEFFWSAFSRIWTEYGEIFRVSPDSFRMRGNTDQKNSEHGHFSCSVEHLHVAESNSMVLSDFLIKK